MSIRRHLHRLFPVAALSLAACSFDPSGLPVDSDGSTVFDAPVVDAGIDARVDADPGECIGQPDGTPCGDPTDTECNGADTCLAEVCVDNLVDVDTLCGDPSDTECTAPDTCDGAGTCLDNHVAADTGCGDGSTTECTNPDTCDGNGLCRANHVTMGSACGSGSTTECTNPDTCDGNGSCQANHVAMGSACGSGSTTECTNPDSCDGNGTCDPNHVMTGTACGDGSDTDCTNPDSCDGSGNCDPNHANLGMACGDPSNSACTNPDTCDGSGGCLANDEAPGTACGDPTNNDCTNPDTCDGSGSCLVNDEAAGTACGDPTNSNCTDPDTCDGSGTCLVNHAGNGLGCTDCAAGNPAYCDSCLAGVCENIPCSQNTCYVDTDCSAAATFNTCVDQAGDCVTTSCVGGSPSSPIEAGAPAATNFNSWQSFDDATQNGMNLWYCNATLPVSAAGILDAWTISVALDGSNGEVAQLAVIRCGSGGGGGGPAFSNCTRVGLGPINTISGNGVHTFSLAGSTQLDGATPDGSGIVVQSGDILCADANQFRIGVDCNGSSLNGGCPGPDFDTQYEYDIDTRGQPFVTNDSSSDGVLMIKATGSTIPVLGDCADDTPEPDGTSCSVGGGNTCCSSNCQAGPCN